MAETAERAASRTNDAKVTRLLDRPAAESRGPERRPVEARDAAEARSPAEAPPPAKPAEFVAGVPPRRRWLRPVLFALLPVALAAGGYAYVTGGRIVSTENAYVRADIAGVTTDVSGIVKEVAVRENQTVAVGDVLFRLDDLPFRLALARAEARVGIVAAEVGALKASYRDMQAQIAQSEVDVGYYAHELERQQQLAARSYASQATFESAQRNLQSSRQKVSSLREQLAGIAANLAGDPEIAVERHPRSLEAVAQRDEAARQLDHATVRAPMAGTVTNVPSLQPGQYLASATPAFSIVASDHLWIEANPKETELTHVRPGQPATISVDSYPDDVWHGTVESVSPASAASFSMLPAQNTSGNWVKVVQRIPMRVRIETPDGSPPLRAGMSVVVEVDTGRARGLPGLLARWLGRDAPRQG